MVSPLTATVHSSWRKPAESLRSLASVEEVWVEEVWVAGSASACGLFEKHDT